MIQQQRALGVLKWLRAAGTGNRKENGDPQ
jgi:hypothetical protein